MKKGSTCTRSICSIPYTHMTAPSENKQYLLLLPWGPLGIQIIDLDKEEIKLNGRFRADIFWREYTVHRQGIRTW